jgi:hypothetical protein
MLKKQVFKLMSALCVYSEMGYKMAVDALSHYKVIIMIYYSGAQLAHFSFICLQAVQAIGLRWRSHQSKRLSPMRSWVRLSRCSCEKRQSTLCRKSRGTPVSFHRES